MFQRKNLILCSVIALLLWNSKLHAAEADATEATADVVATDATKDEGTAPDLEPVEIKDAPPPKPLSQDEMDARDEANDVTAPSGPKDYEQFNRPLFFAPEDNKIEITNPQVGWDMNHERINLGGLIFQENSIRINLDQIDRDKVPSRFREGSRSEKKVTNISFVWPSIMTRVGRLTIENGKGKVIWSTQIDEDERARWVDLVARDEKQLLKLHSHAPWGVVDANPEQWPFMANGSQFRFCFTKQNSDKEAIRFCSHLYTITKNGDGLRLNSVDENKVDTVMLGKTNLGPHARVNFPPGKKIILRVQFKNGTYAQISSRPLEIHFLDVVSSPDQKKIVLTGRGAKPLGPVTDIEVPPNHFWSATGQAKEVVWRLEVSRDLPLVRVLGAWNVPFSYVVRYQALPSEADRIFIHRRTGSGSYVNGARIQAYSPGGKLESQELKATARGGNLYRWNFKANNSGESNNSRISITESKGEKRTWVAHYDLFRGYSSEVSARLTGIIDANLHTAVIGEVAGAMWFERLFGMDSYGLSERRWGLSARYFKSLTAFSFTEGDSTTQAFSVLNGELRYNLIPGIWNRDELFGLVLGGEQVKVAGSSESFGGGGAYWARTMPKFLDDIFNFVPGLHYPKYVDVEFIYYPFSFVSSTQARATFNLNFHGKVFWSKRFYGEAGFGIKRFDFLSEKSQSDLTISTAYGTVGLGFAF